MNLTVKGVSDLLDVSEKTVYRWLGAGRLPAYRLSGQYRFSRAEILEWATANRLKVSARTLHEADDPNEPLPTLAEALEAGGIFYRIGGTDRESALRSAVETLRLPDEVDREFLLEALLAREQLASTGIGDGIAIAHARNPVVLHVVKPVLALCFLEQAVDFGALDGRPVRALFTLVSPSARAHLDLLSRLSFALRDADFKNMVLAQADRDTLLGTIRRLGRGVPQRGRTPGVTRRSTRRADPHAPVDTPRSSAPVRHPGARRAEPGRARS
ncbi:MAG: PTS sugar transporter subunit IIA [Verrucomicrobia bacterium]|jgi:PTS system nitrogen regulatory IIA component|nr:PTS sugar transporter subunit IIA [Verrucomicrobiota bacterium]OQC65685.1 MAG: PTS system fructose-specific EIIABC component [Verrucomicrobia bacterium ADurb.Bin006]MDI9379407.1 PTS sugar transporter subunit IIA [Verrucomicrobiota bacterium]NMD19222.1 PTS transporter subunit EIIA [Verrucomicrobiota bacterium]HOA60403.1 PTS sugar transporter subunit IIA [Verrucomicrobiota bacterium]